MSRVFLDPFCGFVDPPKFSKKPSIFQVPGPPEGTPRAPTETPSVIPLLDASEVPNWKPAKTGRMGFGTKLAEQCQLETKMVEKKLGFVQDIANS
jgi:hypothetical protein